MNYYQLLKEQAEQQPNKLLVAVDDMEWSYGNLLEQTDRLIGNLQSCLIGQSQDGSILVLADTLIGQLLGFFALQALSVRPILLHHDLMEHDVQEILQVNRLQGILKLNEQCKNCEISSFSLIHEEKEFLSGGALPGNDDIIGVLSSGSAGTPKVMYRTYESWAGFFPVQNTIFHINSMAKLFLQGSLSFTGNLNSFLSVLYAGGSVVTSAKMHCRQWALLIERYQADVMYLIPTKLQLLTAAVKRQLCCVTSLFTGSQLLSSRNICDLKRLLPQAELILYYGASELNYITYAICEDSKRDSCNLGRPFPGVGVTVREGLIYVNTPYHVSGIKNPFTVKDTGRFNKKGELLFEGRRDAWVNKGGYKISTLRLENEIRAIDGICEAVVLPYEDSLRGNKLAVFVVREQTASISVVRAAIRHTLKPVDVPDIIRFLPNIPLNDRGKTDLQNLRSIIGSRRI